MSVSTYFTDCCIFQPNIVKFCTQKLVIDIPKFITNINKKKTIPSGGN